MAYAALWFSFKVPQNSPREKIERPGLFYSKLNTFIYGVYMYGSIVQQFIVDYRAANRMHANQDGMLRQVLIDFLLSVAITAALSVVNMLVVSRIF